MPSATSNDVPDELHATDELYPECVVHWGHGGLRPGAGRKRWKNVRQCVFHRRRPAHRSTYPSQITMTFLRSVGDLRRQRIYNALKRILEKPRPGFQVVYHSIQKDHIHLIAEASNRNTLSSGMRSVSIRIALKLNELLGRRRGKVVRDRYHRRDLFSGKQVRRSLVYVLLNGAKHKRVAFGALDPFSSSATFDGWRDVDGVPNSTGDPAPVPRTSLLRSEWRELGLISPEESIRWAPPMD